MAQEQVTVEVDPRGVATVTINRPERHNAFNDEVIALLRQQLETLERQANVRIVIVTGSGKSFSSGADLEWMKSAAGRNEETNRQDSIVLARLMRTLYEYDKPTIARINGSAFGGALGLIASCDIAIAVNHAQFAFSEARLGLVPAVIAPYIYKAIGERHTRRLFLTAERFSSNEAARIGLIHQAIAQETFDAAVETVIEELLNSGPEAIRACKSLIRSLGVDTDDEASARLIAQLRASSEGQEGMNAFFEKRLPSWIKGD